MIYVLYKAGMEPFKTIYWNAADIKIAQGWELIDSYEGDVIKPIELIGEPIKRGRKRKLPEIAA